VTQLNSKTLYFLTVCSNVVYFFLKSQKIKPIKYKIGNNLLIANSVWYVFRPSLAIIMELQVTVNRSV